MPKISLVVCLRGGKALLQRLLENCVDCYDELIVVHDGPEEESFLTEHLPCGSRQKLFSPEKLSLSAPGLPPKELALDYASLKSGSHPPKSYRCKTEQPNPESIHALVKKYEGLFFEGPRCFQQEPHWPFAWWVAKFDWILRLDSDEYPSAKMRNWLQLFRGSGNPNKRISGYSCIWPLWDGKRAIFKSTAEWRPFLFNKKLVEFLGVAEQMPIPRGGWHSTGLVLCHRPSRKSFGLRNLILRRQAYFWRKCISASLMEAPSRIPRWNYSQDRWPPFWDQIIRNPLATGLTRFLASLARDFRAFFLRRQPLLLSDYFASAVHQLLISWSFGIFKFRDGFKKFLAH